MTKTAMTRTTNAVLAAATVTTGLTAGVWFAYACSVMPALGRSDDRVFIEVMQNINDVIQNPVFFAVFFGALVLSAVAAWQLRATPATRWTLAALLLSVAVLVVTSAVNVPLNDALAAAGPPASIADPAGIRDRFEAPWTAWNTVRGVLSTASLLCLLRAAGRLCRA